MDDSFEDGPVCDFCEISVDKDEMLEPIYVGELPQPEPHRLRRVASRERDHLLGKPIGIYTALYQAIRGCDDIEVEEFMNVEELKTVGGETHFADMESGVPFETRRRDDKVAVSLKIHPKDMEYEPDAKVCDTCAEMFSSLSD